MPTLFNPPELATTGLNGVAHTLLANPPMVGAGSLQVDRLKLNPGTRTSVAAAPNSECFLYVIRGSGFARSASEALQLEPESALWFEPGDDYLLEAGGDSLEALICHASSP
ncbi:MAG: hypothetical protein M1570_11270 [Chloroflexi bacterium]|nr:hypothetical protein [Chloroflexota bacterium]